ncbi:molybdopterin-dependent oxidoreductase [Microbacterium betulae]|uniref:Molybdopterin-dependent oxidoreductase n=1 Tax=Microbacterium betulae TaxID=2981139 RepID=A0AA97I650_9MICO|nr:molybdopterin-dependent oxidoreductase [Microbacterium sp. AB]WOF22140.1 molybdopterin-dependent oxidoreductase [Microbacterium sp. AB]
MERSRERASSRYGAMLAGAASAAVFLAAAELTALLVAREGSPILAVGGFVVDVVPQPLKEFAISTFGERDKDALLLGLALAVLVAAAIAGVLERLRPPLGVVVVAVAGAASLAATVTRPGATAFAWAPAVAGTIAGSVALVLLSRRLRRGDDAGAGAPSEAPPEKGTSRRGFLVIAALTGASALVVGLGARALNAASSSVTALREALRLPSPRSTVSVPDGAELDVDGLSPLFTPNADFYRVDTALTVPAVDPATWSLVVDGMVDRRVEIGFDELVAMGLDEYAITLTCVSNEVGGDLVGNAIWLGVPVRDVLRMAGVRPDADMVLSRSVDGYTASTPLASLTDDGVDAILAVGMNGEPLPLEHGFPVRMVVPGLYGYVSATKWVTELKVTTFAADEAYWTPRGYSAEAPIKLSSRIDTPRAGASVTAGRVPIAGVAWAQTVGIERVEVRVDDGAWQEATLSSPLNEDTWVQWRLDWDAEPGAHYVTVRATDKDGGIQVEERTPIAPDGATGWQRTLVTVG